mgnify:CR=1 FL=1|tara:strand:- start:53371 stop:54852 length:1482 start_codon:yes stop_codon:yes gene_type:complete
MKALLLVASTLFLGTFLFGQTQNSAYTAVGKGVATTFLTDYQCLGINNSALGWGTGFGNTRFTMGTSELHLGIQSPALNKERLQNAYQAIMNEVRGNNDEPFDVQQQIDAAKDYAEAGISINANYNWFGASFQDEKFGGIAVSISENYNWYSQINSQTSDLIFRGRLSGYFDSLTIAMNGDTSTIANDPSLSQDTLNSVIRGTANNPDLLSDITNGSRIKFVWNRYYNFGYGRKLFGQDSTFALYAGVGGRYIQSMAMFDMQSGDDGIQVNSAISPFFDINYGTGMNNMSNSGALPESVGSGYGVDLSASVILLDKIRLAAAVNNIGSVKYTRNVYSVRDTLVESVSLAGLEDANIPETMNQLAEDGGLLNLVGEEEIVVNNAANFRLGGSINFNDIVHVGVDVVAPFNKDNPGSLQNAVLSVGGDVRPVKWLQLSAGYFGGGVYAHSIPVGVNFIIGGGKYEVGVSSRDMLSFFLDDANSLSAAFGFARFRF